MCEKCNTKLRRKITSAKTPDDVARLPPPPNLPPPVTPPQPNAKTNYPSRPRGVFWLVLQAANFLLCLALGVMLSVEHPVTGIPLLGVLVIGFVYVWKRGAIMQLEFNVGQLEQHHVVYRFNQMWGGLQITVDGVSVVKTVQLHSRTNSQEDFVVGKTEIHHVRIEKRSLLFASLRPQVVTAYVDGVKVAEGATMRRQQ